jgi:hypothetical protein
MYGQPSTAAVDTELQRPLDQQPPPQQPSQVRPASVLMNVVGGMVAPGQQQPPMPPEFSQEVVATLWWLRTASSRPVAPPPPGPSWPAGHRRETPDLRLHRLKVVLVVVSRHVNSTTRTASATPLG